MATANRMITPDTKNFIEAYFTAMLNGAPYYGIVSVPVKVGTSQLDEQRAAYQEIMRIYGIKNPCNVLAVSTR